jgi:hypothetical protein
MGLFLISYLFFRRLAGFRFAAFRFGAAFFLGAAFFFRLGAAFRLAGFRFATFRLAGFRFATFRFFGAAFLLFFAGIILFSPPFTFLAKVNTIFSKYIVHHYCLWKKNFKYFFEVDFYFYFFIHLYLNYKTFFKS